MLLLLDGPSQVLMSSEYYGACSYNNSGYVCKGVSRQIWVMNAALSVHLHSIFISITWERLAYASLVTSSKMASVLPLPIIEL